MKFCNLLSVRPRISLVEIKKKNLKRKNETLKIRSGVHNKRKEGKRKIRTESYTESIRKSTIMVNDVDRMDPPKKY